ncbi:ABC transporter ATP-binding protein [Streptomyces sp. SAI-127]|uniref:ABC transporter ATP-binding protein n=1 Tax=Streptomyces sp. SAI-127 TaxID=2940543 RepID=UPI00247475FC|nr:ABC transporter ATP-binding protein [Streptomyces sp. SAI-127]MDH6492292.1 ATP-binding cassette subfamily B protein [Streptomyces sp. SAI-127]
MKPFTKAARTTTGKVGGTAPSRIFSVLRHVLRLSRRTDPRAARLIVVLTVAYALSISAIAVSQRWIVESCRGGITLGVLTAVGVAMAGQVVRGACHRIQTHLQGDLADRVAMLLTDETLRATADIPTITHLEESGDLNRIAILQRGTRKLAQSCWTIADAAAAALSLGLSIVLLASISPAVIGLAVLAAPPIWFGKRGHRIVAAAEERVAETMRHERRLHSLCISPDSAKEIWISGSGAHLSDLADQRWEECTAAERTARAKAALWQVAGWACYAVGLVGALAVVAQLVQGGQAGLGDVILVITLSVRLRLQVSDAVGGVGEIAEVRQVAAEYLWLQDYEAGHPGGREPAPTSIGHGLVLKDVSFTYPHHDHEVLSHINLSIAPGSTVGIVGLNGAGKSTLIKLLLGMYRPVRGEIALDGRPTTAMNPAQWYARNAAVFQDFSKFHLPVSQVVGIGDMARKDDETVVRRAVDAAGAASLIDVLPHGLNTLLGTSHAGTELSHGQWQKLALARSLMREEPLLTVLDEPTAALDPQAEHDLFEQIAERAAVTSRRRGGITVFISHRFSTLRMVDQIVVLEDGKVVENGTHEELMAAGLHYAALYKAQASAYT